MQQRSQSVKDSDIAAAAAVQSTDSSRAVSTDSSHWCDANTVIIARTGRQTSSVRRAETTDQRSTPDTGGRAAAQTNKPVIDRRRRPWCCHQAVASSAQKSRPVRPLACNWYCCAPFIAKPKAAHALHSVRHDVEQPRLTCKYDIIYETGST